MSTARYRYCVSISCVCFSLSLWSGCGAYVVNGGLYPLPAIHIINPLPSKFGLEYEAVTLISANDQPMYAWFIPAPVARATILMHHGAMANRSSALTHANLLHALGCNVFLYDYEGFGESWALATLDTLLPDAEVALTYVQAHDQPGAPPIILFGASMGTMPAFAQAARNPGGVVALIAEGSCVPRELPTNLFYNLGITPGPEAFLHVPQILDPDINVPEIAMPKLFIHSRSDLSTPFAGAQRLYDEAVEPKEFQEVSGDHLAAIEVDAAHYRAIWSAFLDEIVGPQVP